MLFGGFGDSWASSGPVAPDLQEVLVMPAAEDNGLEVLPLDCHKYKVPLSSKLWGIKVVSYR